MSSVPEASQYTASLAHAELWIACKESGDAAARARLIELYLPFARMLAAKAYAKRTHEEHDFADYYQHASVGLIDAVDRFNLAHGVKFETYAGTRVTGHLLNQLEALSETQGQIAARQRILKERRESMKDGSEHAETSPLAYLAEIAIGLAIGFVLEGSGMIASEEATYPDNAYGDLEMKQLRARACRLVETLPERERHIVKEHYFHHRLFEEIAVSLDLTKARVSQLHKQALRRLHESMCANEKLDMEG